VFVAWDLYAISVGHWTYDLHRMTGVLLPGGLPLDEVLFFVVTPTCAILAFEAVRHLVQGSHVDRLGIGIAVLGVSIVVNFFVELEGMMVGGFSECSGLVAETQFEEYREKALEKLGVWSSVEKKVAGAESVRAALALVSRGEAPYGIVYQTDVSADPGVAVVGTFPEDSHPPIIYPIAITANSTNPDTQAYVDYLKSAKAVPFFEHEGFTVLKR